MNRNASLDFAALRAEGIKHLEKMSGDHWTDFNAHDPGITILEQLCYAISDLCYRINYGMEDLLARKTGDPYSSLPSAAASLSCNPVTIEDMRRVIIDLSGVDNAWITPVERPCPHLYYNPNNHIMTFSYNPAYQPVDIKGLYHVLIQKTPGYMRDTVINDVWKTLMTCRNLGEDIESVELLREEKVVIDTAIDIAHVDEPERLEAEIRFRIADLLANRPRFNTLDELREQGLSPDDIFNGPKLTHGFIRAEELHRCGIITEIRASEFISEIMKIKGVQAVRSLSIRLNDQSHSWIVKLPQGSVGVFDYDGSGINFFRNNIQVNTDKKTVKLDFNTFQDNEQKSPLEPPQRDIVVEPGRYRDIGRYYSIQEEFPSIYGIAPGSLPENTPVERRQQAQQLKAYLLFFEQILANWFAQIDHVKDLFSTASSETVKTYFNRNLADIVPEINGIIDNGYLARMKANEGYLDTNLDRRNRFLNHLLARFAEELQDSALTDHAGKGDQSVTGTDFLQIIKTKEEFLQRYPHMSYARFRSCNYRADYWDSDNISGLKMRIGLLLGIPIHNDKIGDGDKEGFHILEHILLRPRAEDNAGQLEFAPGRSAIKTFMFQGQGAYSTISCNSRKHGLSRDEIIEVLDAGFLNGIYRVEAVSNGNNFEIKPQRTLSNGEKGQLKGLSGDWRPTSLPFLTFKRKITDITIDQEIMTCTSFGHGLQTGDEIRILGVDAIKDSFAVAMIDQNRFSIEPGSSNSVNLKDNTMDWIRVTQLIDPYSLQLTFAFPRDIGRFKDNLDFCRYIEMIIRSETPAHLRVYIQWFDHNEMEYFENTLDQLMNELQVSSEE